MKKLLFLVVAIVATGLCVPCGGSSSGGGSSNPAFTGDCAPIAAGFVDGDLQRQAQQVRREELLQKCRAGSIDQKLPQRRRCSHRLRLDLVLALAVQMDEASGRPTYLTAR